MQYKSFSLLIFCGILSLVSSVYALPPRGEIIEKIKTYNLFDKSQLDEMCRIEESEYGYPAWAAAFSIVQNSDLDPEEQLMSYVYLIALAIDQTNDKDAELNDRIKYWLQQMDLYKEEVCWPENFSIDTLRQEFQARSNPSSPATSDEDGSPLKKRARTE